MDGDGGGAMPAWYPILRAARYLGIHPEDLLKRSPVWFFRALIAERAENAAARDALKHQ